MCSVMAVVEVHQLCSINRHKPRVMWWQQQEGHMPHTTLAAHKPDCLANGLTPMHMPARQQ
jgi:hypothetical protein